MILVIPKARKPWNSRFSIRCPPIPCTCSSLRYSSSPTCFSGRNVIIHRWTERGQRLEQRPRTRNSRGQHPREEHRFNSWAVRSRAERGSIGITATRKQQEQRRCPVSREISRASRNNPQTTPQSSSVGTNGYARTESIGCPHCSIPASPEVIMKIMIVDIAALISRC